MSEWMTHLPVELKGQPISKLCIPGSHNSACYDLKNASGIAMDQSFSKKIKWVGWCCCVRKVMSNWGTTQSMFLSAQLYAGVRYFDFRIQQTGKDEFHVVHGLIAPRLFLEYFLTIAKFLDKHLSEVVIVNISHMYEMNPKDFDSLLEDIVDMTEHRDTVKMCPKSVNLNTVTLDELVKTNNRLILIGPTSIPGNSGLIRNRWPNKNNIDDLLEFMSQEVRHEAGGLKVVQGVITPSGKDIAKNLCKSLKTALALPCRDAVKAWIQNLGPDEVEHLNVLIIDEVDKEFCRAVIALNAPGTPQDDPMFHVIEPLIPNDYPDAVLQPSREQKGDPKSEKE